MGWYDRIQEARQGGGMPRMSPGNYVVQVYDVKEHPGQTGGTFWIAEFVVLQSDNAAHPVNTPGSECIRLDSKFPQTALGDVKACVAALMGLNPKDQATVDAQITPQVVGAVTHTKPTPVAGHIVGLNVFSKNPGPRSQPGAQPFNRYRWAPMLENGAPMRRPLPQGFTPPTTQAAPPPAQPPQGQWSPQGAPAPQGPPQGAPAPWSPPQAAPPPAQAPVFPPGGFQFGGGAPAQPPAPPAAPPPPAAFPPPGWTPHPTPGWFYKGQTVVSEADLRTLAATGRA